MTEVDITYCNTNTPTELYCVLPGQENPQPVTIHLDVETGELWANYNPEVGNSVDARAWHSIVRTWNVPTVLTSAAMNELLNEIKAQAVDLLDESEVVWDGSNHVGVLSDAGHGIEKQIMHHIVEYAHDPGTGRVEPVSAGELLAEFPMETLLDDEGIEVTADTSDDRLSEIESEIELGVEAENAASVVVIEGLDRMLREYRDELREQARERLTEIRDELNGLRAQRDDLVRRIYGWGAGDSDRTLEALAGVSRATIARIRRHNNTLS